MKTRTLVLGLGLLAGCMSEPTCPPIPELWPAAGTGTTNRAWGPTLVPSTTEQTLTISPTHDYLEYTFKINGVSYTARYSLSKDPAPSALPFVFVQRPRPLPTCAELQGIGPIIDAIEIRRSGARISIGEDSRQSPNGCPGQLLPKPSPLDGPPDGQGAALGGAEYFAWRLSGKETLQSGDEVTVTVLDFAAKPFEVFAGSYEYQGTVKLGVLNGSGTVVVP